MNLIDEIYTKHPYFGVRRIKKSLEKEDEIVNRKKIRRLMREMGIYAIYPKPNLSLPNKEHLKYPYLLRNLNINKADQVWASDITYIRMNKGFVYLTVVMDWYSRYILSYSISNTLSNDFCIDALNKALKIAKPDIFNTDQGVQYTSESFTNILKKLEIKISMNGKRRAIDNVLVERFWRSIKQEKIYINDYVSVKELKDGIEQYIKFYNYDRQHQALGYKTPHEVYSETLEKKFVA